MNGLIFYTLGTLSGFLVACYFSRLAGMAQLGDPQVIVHHCGRDGCPIVSAVPEIVDGAQIVRLLCEDKAEERLDAEFADDPRPANGVRFGPRRN